MHKLSVLFSAIILALVPGAILAQDEIPSTEQPPSPVSSSVIDGFLSMSNESLYLFVIAGVLSFLCAIVFRQGWANDLKAAIFAVICFAAGAVYTYVDQDNWQTSDWIRRGITMAVVGTLFYLAFKNPLRTFTLRTDHMIGRTN